MSIAIKQFGRVAALATALLAAGCANVSLIPADKPAAVGNGVTVMPQRPWNQIKGNYLFWTAEGPNVDQFFFFTGIKSGKSLIDLPGVKDEQIGLFDSKMLPNDIQDLVVSTLSKMGDQTVKPGNLMPCPFGSGQGFCFDLNFSTAGGLQMKAMAMARKQSGILDVFLFQAPSEYYFEALSPTVSKVFASAQAK